MIVIVILILVMLRSARCQDIITTIAGTGSGTYSGDGGDATSAALNQPSGVAVDSTGRLTYIYYTLQTYIIWHIKGNAYIGDLSNYRVRKLTIATGIISTIAGTGVAGYSGDDVAATSSTFNCPAGVTVDSSGAQFIYFFSAYCVISPLRYIGNVYIADQCNHRIRKVTVSTGIVTTIAGTGASSFDGDSGAATSASLQYPWGVALDASGTQE